MAHPFLIEIGTEELPASFVERAVTAIPDIARELFSAARLAHGDLEALGSPRRLALYVDELALHQPDVEELVMGPPKSIALDANGKPTGAALGFAKKNGVGPEGLRVETTPKGEYIAVLRQEKGRPAREVLPELLATLTSKIPFQKSMRWGEGKHSFGRPIHWIVALHGSDVVPMRYADVASGRTTRGHRFLAPEQFELASASVYEEKLREAHVLVSIEARRSAMNGALSKCAASLGGELVPDDMLVHECTSLVEEPFVVPGRFDEEFLDLPEGVIVAVMRGHQRYFAVRDAKTGALMPRYLNVVNTALDTETISRGNDRVLRARLKDARFFVGEDRKTLLAERTAKLDGIVFQQKLGTVGAKVKRVSRLAESVGMRAGLPPKELEAIREAAALAKNDLVTLIVGEFPELQGEMGRFYALEQGVAAKVADAIRDHYAPRGASDKVPTSPIAACLAVADRLDTLVGCFGIGLVPSGSADPFALRRAALGVVRIALEGPIDVRLKTETWQAIAGYESVKLKSRDEIAAALFEFFRARLKAIFGDRTSGDVIDACLAAWDGESIRDFEARLGALEELRKLPEYESLAVAFKRAYNIAKDAKPGDVDATLLEAGPETALAERFRGLAPQIEAHEREGRYRDALLLVARELRTPIDTYFEKVFVMVDDEKVRENRLRLLASIARTMTRIAHFHLLTTR